MQITLYQAMMSVELSPYMKDPCMYETEQKLQLSSLKFIVLALLVLVLRILEAQSHKQQLGRYIHHNYITFFFQENPSFTSLASSFSAGSASSDSLGSGSFGVSGGGGIFAPRLQISKTNMKSQLMVRNALSLSIWLSTDILSSSSSFSP